MLNRAAPSAEQTRAAIKFLLQTDNAQMGYQVQQGNDLGKYLAQGGDPHGFESWYAKTFPMTNAIGAIHLQSGGTPSPQKTTAQYSDADLKHTAMKHGISVEEVKRRLGAQ